MSDESNNDTSDDFTEDPRIGDLVGRAASVTELVLNAEFLLGEYVNDFLQKACPEAFRMARTLGMTPEQKFHLAIGTMGALEDTEYGGQVTFAFLRELYRIRATAGRVPEDKLLAELTSSYLRTGGEEARETYQESFDVEATMRNAVAANLVFAQSCLTDVLEPDEDSGDSE